MSGSLTGYPSREVSLVEQWDAEEQVEIMTAIRVLKRLHKERDGVAVHAEPLKLVLGLLALKVKA